MDTLTHAISGAVLGRATAGIDGSALPVRRRVGVGFLAAAFPDIDFVARPFVDPITFLNIHRGVTHSVILLPLWALLLGCLFAFLFRDGRPRDYLPLAAMALGIHIAGDVITAYGTMIFAPFSGYKAAIPTTFIIDLWFTGILLLGLAGSRLRRASRLPAALSLLVLVLYVGFQGIQLVEARQVGHRYALEENLQGARVTAVPQPLSPFNWKVFVETGTIYRVAAVNLRRDEASEVPRSGWVGQLMAHYRPSDDLRWHTLHKFGSAPEKQLLAREAWYSEPMEGFRQFARFPHLFDVDHREDAVCAWFMDLRFTRGDPTTIEGAPFRFGACRDDEDDPWRLYRYADPPQPVL